MSIEDRRKLILLYVKAVNGWIRQGGEAWPDFLHGLDCMAWGIAVPSSQVRLMSRTS